MASGATNVAPTNIITIALPERSVAADSNAWSSFVTNGNCVVIQTNGLTTVVRFHEGQNWYGNWGLGFNFETVSGVDMDGYIFTETATSTNYCYVLEGIGSAEVGANVFTPMGLTNSTGWAYLPLYAMNFDAFPPLLSHFVDNPHFMGTPMPATYTGRSDLELSGLTAIITNQIWLTNDPTYTNLDNSPELRRSPILDQFVADMGNNPLALANYVINNIGLTDPMGNIESYNQVSDSIEVGGVNRAALGTFLEGQGSPTEQCALLVYLLRAAGYPAAYVWPTNSNMKLMDTTVSRLWQINVHGIIFYSGIPVVTNSLITVNYPWVVANIGTNTVQIFPWIKNTSIVEGQNIYAYTPANYPDAYSFVKAYALANPSLMALASPNAGVATVWQQWLTSVINTNQLQPNLSLNDFGVVAYNRPNTYTSWSQLPVPDFMTNQSQVAVVHTLSDSSITYPFLTNMFDTIRIQVFNNTTNAANQIFDTGMWRACDFHNRKLLLYTNTTSTASLWLAGYRPGITAVTNFQNFATGTNSLDIQIAQTNIAGSVTNFQVEITYQRRDATLISPANLWLPTAEAIQPVLQPTFLTCQRSDVSAILPGVARVTQPMLQVYAQDYWSLEQQKAANTNFVPAVTAEAGDAAMILASTFFQKMWSDDQFNQQIHKVHGLTWFSQGVGALTPLSNGGMVVKLNMNWFVDYLIGNAEVEQDAGDWGEATLNNYITMVQAEGSSAEHSVIASVWGDQSPVSAIRLIQIAAQNSITNGTAMPLELNIDNYTALGNQSYTGYGSTLLKNQIPSLWASVTNVFTTEWDSNFVRVLITPGQVTNATGSFIGMSALFFGNGQAGDLLSQDQATLHGGESDDIFWVGDYDFYPTYDLTYNLDYSPSVGYTFTYVSITTPQPQYYFSPYSALTANTGGSGQTAQIAYTPQQTTQASLFSAGMNVSFNSTPSAIQAEKNTGYFGPAWSRIKQAGSVVAEPVQVVSGDFYSDNVDMTLAGPMPLQLRRNYFSRNVADGEFGTGWKLSLMPRLVLTTNAANNPLIYAAEPDGSVLAYRYQTNNLWTVMAADNPDLVNFTSSGIGGKANLFNNTIQQNATNSGIYTLFGSDGSQRTYQVMTNFAITAGTNQLSRIHPYLTRWQDAAGNYYQFTYGTNSANNNFGQLYRAQSANGASLTFEYDYYGRIIQAISDDDRIVNYQYDNYGDLVSVTLPDNTQWQYGYHHYTFTANSQTYTDSDHMLVSETKPNGREVVNTYDSLRRVIMQQATVGANRQLITNAWFTYNNNCTTLTNGYVSGYTLMNDVFSNSYFYYYTNNLVTQIQEPLGLTNIQSWFSTSQSNQPGYYQQSLQFSVDVRGLTNAFLYDSNGNITNQIIYGDLTGNGVGGQSATNTSTYTTNNCPATAIDPSGNQLTFVYNDPSDAYHLTDLQFSSGGVGVATNHWLYTNVTTIVNMGGWYETNTSYGLCYQEILADSATNAWIYNGRGFPIQLTRYAATADVPYDSDPPVVTYFTFTPRGDLATMTDASGRQVNMNYDQMGRLQWRDVFDQFSNVVSRENFYYNQNGDLEWYDGPRSNPDDYIWFSYDGAGRKVQEIHWRTQANPNGTGIEAVPGNNLYATTFYAYDFFGNLTSVTDQRGAFTTNKWDALGRLMQRSSFDVGGSTLLAAEGFSYEAGSLIQSYTNALGGVTTTRYTSTGQPEFRQNADGSTNGWTYYLDGRIQNEFQGNGAYWQTTYNDANLTVTRIFYSATALPLATNSIMFDRRGNAAQWTDAGGNTFANSFDGLNRVKTSAGPAIVTITPYQLGNPPSGTVYYATNVLQQSVTNFYDAAGIVVTNINALGEETVTTLDALGRATSILIYGASGSLVRERYFAYSADHNSVTITDGSGANAISHTVYTDSDGHAVLSVAYPSANTTEFTLNQFDVVGNLISAQHDSSVNGAVTTWTTANYSFDGLNRMTSKIDRDNAPTTYAYDSMGDLTNCTMPGNLQWQASYNNAGQILQEQNFGGGNPTRTTTYSYYSSGNAFAGLLQTKTDGRATSCTLTYDDWLRPTNITYSGSLPEQNSTTIWQYEPRGFVTGITEQFASTNTGPTTTISRSFDPYGQLSSESVSAGSFSYSAGQSFDAAGRRTGLGLGSGYSFGWQADGNLILASDSTGNGDYTFNTAGMLASRAVGSKYTSINSRDGEGRPLSISTTINMLSELNESLTWSGDGLLAAHTLARADFTDSRAYTYANLSRRLVQEQLNLNASTTWTNTMLYDNGGGGGPGVLTQMGQANSASNEWSGAADAFSRVATETNSTSPFPAYGHINGQSILVSGWLDNQPVSISAVGTNAMQWRATMELAPGAHQLKVSALHPSEYFTAWATNSFTNNLAYQATVDSYDGAGDITNRVWKNPSGTVEQTQTFSWDARGRLHAVTDRDANNSGYNWSAVYDALNRRLQTTAVLVSNGVASTAPPQTINSYFDPQVEFLELGASYGDQTVWKLYGPDLDGTYGGENGTGGLDGVSPYLNLFYPTISDARGNILAEVTNGVVSWNPARPTGYGAVPGYRPAAFANGADMAQSSAWRGREVDITGYYNDGRRVYDPVSGRWLAFDSVWNAGDPDGYTFCAGGDPINSFDPDGRVGKAGATWGADIVTGVGHLTYNTAGTLEYALTSPFAPNWAYRTYGQEAGDFGNTVVGVAHTTYDVAAMASYGIVSPFAPNFAYNNYGGSMQRLLGQEAPAFYGGNNKSLAYQITYGTLNAATLFLGGELGETGNAGRMGEATGVAVQTARTATVASKIWGLVPFARGQQIEQLLGHNLPQNFPVIDRFDFATGVATSIKSIDLNAPTYQNAAALTSRLNSYVNSVAGFQGASLGDFDIRASQITARQLQLAIPSGGMSAAQQAAINAAVLRARSMDVNLIVTPVP